MTSEDRIKELEKEVAQLRADLDTFIKICTTMAGRAAPYQDAVLSLVVAHPRNPLFDSTLRRYLASSDTDAFYKIGSEEHLHGRQETQELILTALDSSQSQQTE